MRLSRLPPEYGIGDVDTSGQPDLKRRQIEAVIEDVHTGSRLSPATADLFLETDFARPRSPLGRRISEVSSPPVLIGAAVALKAALTLESDTSIFGTLPAKADAVLRSIESSQQIVNVTAASADVVQHMPTMLLAAGVFDAGRRFLVNGRNARLATSAIETQHMLKERTDEGTQAWDFSDATNHTVAIVGNGGATSGAIAKSLDDHIVQISYKPIPGVNVVLPQDANGYESRVAFDRAHITQARQVLIFPNTAEDELFSPSGFAPEAYDIGVDRAEGIVRRVDTICDLANIPRKPFVIVGNREQSVIHMTAKYGSDFGSGIVEETLGQRMEMLHRERGCPINIIDTTEVVVDTALEIAGEHPLVFSGKKESVEKFAPAFFSAVGDPDHVDPSLDSIPFVYNPRDRSTQARAERDPNIIVAIRDPDPSRKETLLEAGVAPERVLVVAELINRALNPYLGSND